MELGTERSGDRAWGRTKRSAAWGGGAWGRTEAAAQVRSSGQSGRVGALEEEGDENERKCRKKRKDYQQVGFLVAYLHLQFCLWILFCGSKFGTVKMRFGGLYLRLIVANLNGLLEMLL